MLSGIESFITLEAAGKLYKRLCAIRDARTEVVNEIAGTFGDPRLLAKYYVQPNCQNHNPADYDDEVRAPIRTPAFDLLNDFLRDEMGKRDGRTQMFILSDAGMGKTSLLMMLRLTHLTRFWPPGYECRLLKLGPDTLQTIAAIPSNQRNRIVLLLDALDEDKAALGRIKERLLELLRATGYFHRVIISCRTQFFPKGEMSPFGDPGRVVLEGFTCPMVFLSLFDPRQVDEYLERRFPRPWYDWFAFDFERNRQRRKQAQTLVERMGSLRMRPMLLSHADDLLGADAQKIASSFGIYDTLVDSWLNRELIKIGETHALGDRLPSREHLKLACVRVAEWMQQRDQRFIPSNELEQLVQETPQIRYLKEFDIGGRSLLNRNSEGAYRFGHYTIQEFLLAYGLAKELLRAPDAFRMTEQLAEFSSQDWGRLWSRLSGVVERYFAEYAQVYADKMKGGGTGPQMVRLPAGSFVMGDQQGVGERNERPLHRVEISAFSIGRYPLTFDEYAAFCNAIGRDLPDDQGWGQGRRPVIHVSWKDGQAYCDWLSEQTGKPYRLPTEAEWEYACRAGRDTAYSFGDEESALEGYAWYTKNSGKQTHPVGEKAPNRWGLHDMHGNVWEWCDDWIGDYTTEPQANPTGPAQGHSRVLRGGCWFNLGRSLRSAQRIGRTPDDRIHDFGVRLAGG